eukprot:TRINITY_DN68043_c0_g8_i1.p1 TRINITY_DN68043_c0_g8~~TRINITY_DN68043_c0_g8_i1.p1  ORF type:complete len:490 (-),score=26.22 TRINITY_DN68043_c0_g8_i1:116-1399(-)
MTVTRSFTRTAGGRQLLAVWEITPPATTLAAWQHFKAGLPQSLQAVTAVWHGSSRSNISNICASHFKLPSCTSDKHNKDGMLGRSCYFATHAEKAARHAEKYNNNQLLLCDVIPGKAYCTNSHQSAAKVRAQQDTLRQYYNSVWARGYVKTPELAIFDPLAALPRFLIEFKPHPKLFPLRPPTLKSTSTATSHHGLSPSSSSSSSSSRYQRETHVRTTQDNNNWPTTTCSSTTAGAPTIQRQRCSQVRRCVLLLIVVWSCILCFLLSGGLCVVVFVVPAHGLRKAEKRVDSLDTTAICEIVSKTEIYSGGKWQQPGMCEYDIRIFAVDGKLLRDHAHMEETCAATGASYQQLDVVCWIQLVGQRVVDFAITSPSKEFEKEKRNDTANSIYGCSLIVISFGLASVILIAVATVQRVQQQATVRPFDVV